MEKDEIIDTVDSGAFSISVYTLGHAVENLHAFVSWANHFHRDGGCVYDLQELTDFNDTDRVDPGPLKKYGLPTQAGFDPKEVMNVLRMDKKRVRGFDELYLIEQDRSGGRQGGPDRATGENYYNLYSRQ